MTKWIKSLPVVKENISTRRNRQSIVTPVQEPKKLPTKTQDKTNQLPSNNQCNKSVEYLLEMLCVYQIICFNCQNFYIESTIRQLRLRIREYSTNSDSSVCTHLTQCAASTDHLQRKTNISIINTNFYRYMSELGRTFENRTPENTGLGWSWDRPIFSGFTVFVQDDP